MNGFSEPLNIVKQIPDDWNGVVICNVLLPVILGLNILVTGSRLKCGQKKHRFFNHSLDNASTGFKRAALRAGK